jgi:hypothetical protein
MVRTTSSTIEACVSLVNAGTGQASPYPTCPSSDRRTTTTFGDVVRSVVPNRNVSRKDTASGTASTATILTEAA